MSTGDGGAVTGTSTTDLELAELRAKRAELREQREQRFILSPDEQLALEKRSLEEDQALDALEREHGARRVRMVRGELVGAVIVKRPHMATFRKYQDQGETTSSALEQLVRPCVVYPSKVLFDALVADEPAMLHRCANAVCELAGIRVDDARPK